MKRALLIWAFLFCGLESAWAQPLRVRIGLCSLEAPAGSENVLHRLANRAGPILAQLEADLGVRPAAHFRMVLIPRGVLEDPDLVRLDAAAPHWAAGYLLPQQRIGAVRVAEASRYPYGTIESVFAHEVAHMLLHDAAGESLPLWFEEGVATWEGRRWNLQDMVVYTRSLLTSDLPAMADLDPFFRASAGEAELAYAASFAFVSWNARRHGPSLVRDLIREARGRPFPEAWSRVTGGSLESAEAVWRRESLIRYRWIPILTASSTLWIGITLLAVLAVARKRARVQKMRERWDAEEQVEDAVEGAASPTGAPDDSQTPMA